MWRLHRTGIAKEFRSDGKLMYIDLKVKWTKGNRFNTSINPLEEFFSSNQPILIINDIQKCDTLYKFYYNLNIYLYNIRS